jgi:hypothetical protein
LSARAARGDVWSRTRRLALAALGLLLAACGGLTGRVRPAAPVAEIPRGEYQASAFVAMAPTVPPDGEVVAAVVYALPGAGRLEVRDSPRGWLLQRPLGRGAGTEHRALVKSPANYATVAFIRRDGRPLAYAVLHRRGVHGAVQDRGEDSVLFLSTLHFVDPNYIRSDDGRDGH